MISYICDFENQKEFLRDENSEIDIRESPIGTFLCELLSIDFIKAANDIASLIEKHKKSFDPLTQNELYTEVNDLLFSSQCEEYEEIMLMTEIIVHLYKIDSEDEVIRSYGGLRNAILSESFNAFQIAYVLQAYLDESEKNSEMRRAAAFEQFVSGGLEMQIQHDCMAVSLSEYDLLSDIYPGCNVREMVKNVFSKLWEDDGKLPSWELDSLNNLLVSSIYYFFQNGFIFKRCGNCGKFFVPLSRSDEVYCNNISPQDHTRTCKEYGSQKLWYDRVKSDEVAKLSRNVYSAKQMLVRRNPDILAYKEMFEYFKEERKKWERWINSGEKDKEEYISWLNEMKAKKTL